MISGTTGVVRTGAAVSEGGGNGGARVGIGGALVAVIDGAFVGSARAIDGRVADGVDSVTPRSVGGRGSDGVGDAGWTVCCDGGAVGAPF